MNNFNFKKTEIEQAIKWAKFPFFGFAKQFKGLFLFLSFFCFLIFLFRFSSKDFVLENSSSLLGFSIIFFVFGVIFWYLEKFFNSKLKEPKLKITLNQAILNPEKYNLAEFLDFEAASVAAQAIEFCKKRKLTNIPMEVLLYFVLNQGLKVNTGLIPFIFGRVELSFKEIKNKLEKKFQQEKEGGEKEEILGFKEIIFEAAKIAFAKGKAIVGIGDLLVCLSARCGFFQNFLMLNNLEKTDIENLADWYEKIEERILETKEIWKYRNLLKKGSIAKDWAAGYSITLDKYAFDLRKMLEKTSFQDIVGHQKEIAQCERILSKQEISNVLLVGESGTGRKSIVKAIAQKAFLGEAAPHINYKRVLIFDLGQLAAEIVSFEELEAVLEECFAQVALAGNIILVIEEIQNFIGENLKPGVIDISGILSRYLRLPCFQIIALTTYQGLHSVLEKKSSFLNLFEKVEVAEISEKETLKLLEDFLPFFEKKYKKNVNYKALREILKLSSRYLSELPFPEKAVRLLDEAMSWLSISKKEKILKPEHITKIVSEKTGIPLEELAQKEKEILLNLEGLIHQRIINQEEAVKEVSEALRRAKAGIESRTGTIGGFLFLGPTGVGKTETAKALASVYFGSEKRMIRLDMSEFQEVKDIRRLIGGEGNEGLLTIPTRENPFSLILLDEIEKAHPNILNLFLQVLDEGWITDGFGRKIDFKNTIIIATSNAGAEIIRQDIKENKKLSMVEDDLLDHLFKENIFRPEFINRFDGVIVFKPLTKENLFLICHLMLKKLAENLQDKGINFEITKDLKEKIVELSYSPVFGAREMKRKIQDKVENLLTTAILSDRLKRGSKIEIKVENENFVLDIE
ncbi:ATP-dependent Clp protease ATP-binding subunit [Patescibacteria group bacterium]|nr:ATP-dependent Clp protease ATP-binding subunit [Patescibacteria group bacterium]